jgi:hypothetical protein
MELPINKKEIPVWQPIRESMMNMLYQYKNQELNKKFITSPSFTT